MACGTVRFRIAPLEEGLGEDDDALPGDVVLLKEGSEDALAVAWVCQLVCILSLLVYSKLTLTVGVGGVEGLVGQLAAGIVKS